MKTKAFTLDQVETLVKQDILPLLNQYSIVAFYGPLGIGKTTIIKEILRQSGVQEYVTSPTFGYVNTYGNADDTSFNHFDLYRITTLDQFINAGFDEYISRAKTISFIEWPEVIEELLSDRLLNKNVICFILKYDPDDITRRIINCDQW